MERKITETLLKWKHSSNRKALIIKGCRQVGKSYIIDEFLKNNYDSYIKINFEDEKSKIDLFKGDLDADSVLDRLLLDKPVKMIERKSAIFLDEIQLCLGAMSALKPLVLDGRYDIIASGSLLGLKIDKDDRLSPMGYVHIVDMRPMDFEEFLWAMGVSRRITDSIRNKIFSLERIDDYVLKKMTDLFRHYIVVGGMPAAVKAYTETKNYAYARTELNDIISLLRSDASRYSSDASKNKIGACFDSIPVQLSSEKKKFSYARIEKKRYGIREYGPAIDWLVSSGIAYKCHNVDTPKTPLECRVNSTEYKIYAADTGILTSMMEPGVAGTIVNRDPFANNGALMENAIADALIANGYKLFYFSKSNSTLEVDFLSVINGKLTAIEVKSGKNKRSKSLKMILSEKYNVPTGIKISDTNIFTDETGVIHLPLFGASFLPTPDYENIKPVEDIDSLNDAKI